MREEDHTVTFLTAKMSILSQNLSLVQQYFMQKNDHYIQQRQMLENEQYLVHDILQRWTTMEEQIMHVAGGGPGQSGSATSSAGYSNANGPTNSLEYDEINQQTPATPQPQPSYKERNVGPKTPPVIASSTPAVPPGGSSPARSWKGKESHTGFRRQISTSPFRHHSQYPVLPKKRKLPQQLSFSPTQPSQPSEDPFTESEPSSEEQRNVTVHVPDVAPVVPQFVPNIEQIIHTIGPIAVAADPLQNQTSEINNSNLLETTNISAGIDGKNLEIGTQVTKEILAIESFNNIVPEQGEASELIENEEKNLSIIAEGRSSVGLKESIKEESETESRPPKLSPISAVRPSARSLSSRRQPSSQGSRKSSRTIRPSWKLNNSAETILPNASPERPSRDDKEKHHGKDKDKLSPNSRAKKRRAKMLADQPPVLTSQVETVDSKPQVRLSPLNTSKSADSYRGKNLDCKECGKVFSTQHGLRYHIESHLQLKPYKCKICSKAFGQKSTLTRHESTTHTQVKVHGCPICKKYFSSQSELKSHRGRHEAKRNACPVCSRSFIDKRYYKLHVRLCTSKSINDSNGSSQHALFKCPTCQKCYRDPNYFKKHVSFCSKT